MGYDFWAAQAAKLVPQTVRRQSSGNPFFDSAPKQNPAERQYPQNSAATMTVRMNDGRLLHLSGEEAEVADASTAHADAYRKSQDSCPNCRGSNYAFTGKITSKLGSFENRQCFDCGYPVQHTGVPPSIGTQTEGRARMAKQTENGGLVSNWHPKETTHQYM